MRTDVGDDEEGGLGQTQALEALDQVATHLREDPGGDAVEHDADGSAASCGVLQCRPGSVVTVTCGGGDEEPQVRSLQKTHRQSAVGLVHGIEVGGVDEGQTRGHGVGDDGQADLRQRVLGEGLDVLGIDDQHGRARRRAQDPGVGDLGAQNGIDQRRLARAGGTAHDDDGGQFGVGQTGQHVVADLPHKTGAQSTGVGDPVGVEHELQPLQIPHGVRQDVDELGATERGDGDVPGGKQGHGCGHGPTLGPSGACACHCRNTDPGRVGRTRSTDQRRPRRASPT